MKKKKKKNIKIYERKRIVNRKQNMKMKPKK